MTHLKITFSVIQYKQFTYHYHHHHHHHHIICRHQEVETTFTRQARTLLHVALWTQHWNFHFA